MQGPNGTAIRMPVNLETQTVADLKAAYAAESGLDLASLRLVYKTRPLMDNSKILEEVGIRSRDKVLAMGNVGQAPAGGTAVMAVEAGRAGMKGDYTADGQEYVRVQDANKRTIDIVTELKRTNLGQLIQLI